MLRCIALARALILLHNLLRPSAWSPCVQAEGVAPARLHQHALQMHRHPSVLHSRQLQAGGPRGSWPRVVPCREVGLASRVWTQGCRRCLQRSRGSSQSQLASHRSGSGPGTMRCQHAQRSGPRQRQWWFRCRACTHAPPLQHLQRRRQARACSLHLGRHSKQLLPSGPGL